MLNWVFGNEKTMALNIYKNGFTEGYFTSHEAYLVAKYFFREFGYGKDKTKTYLRKFCEKHDKDFNYILLRHKIKEILKNADSEWKIKSEPIYVTQLELDKIREIKNFNAQKALLSFLVFSKRNNGYVYKNSITEIKRISGLKNISCTELIGKYLFFAYKADLIRASNENYFVKFIDNSSKKVLKISDLKGLYSLDKMYIEYCGGILGYCEKCENEFIKRGSTHKYCENCSKERKLEKHEKYNKKRSFA